MPSEEQVLGRVPICSNVMSSRAENGRQAMIGHRAIRPIFVSIEPGSKMLIFNKEVKRFTPEVQ